MTEIQVSLFQLDNYGPWTTSPQPKPEPDLQTLQARVYADLAEGVGSHGGYLFYGRFDNLLGVTNGLDTTAHRTLQEQIADGYPVTVSVGIGTGETPAAATTAASRRLQATGSAQAPGRRNVLTGETTATGPVQVAHFDVVGVTEKYTDTENAYRTQMRMQETVFELSSYLYDALGAMTHFVGGDNAIAVSRPVETAAYENALSHIAETTGLGLQVGIGEGSTAVAAGQVAKRSLEAARHEGKRIVGPRPQAAGD